MPVEFLPDELPGAELAVAIAWGADPTSADPSAWTWSDITRDVLFDDPISITLGRADEASTSQPAKCSIQLDNTTGAYSLGPKSPNYPYVRRNTPVRVRVIGLGGIVLTGGSDSYADTPDDPAMAVGDLDVRLEIEPTSWRPEEFMVLASKSDTGTNRSWAFRLLRSGALEVAWNTDGTSATRRVLASGQPVPADSGRLAVRCTLDVDDGNGGHVATFYTAPTIDGPWTELDRNSGTGTTSIYTGTAPLTVGSIANGAREFSNEARFTGTVGAFELRAGIDGELVVDAEFDTADPYAAELVDDTGRPWTLAAGASLFDDTAFFGYSTEFAPVWNTRGNVATVNLAAHGILRRLGQRQKAVRSSLFRDLSTKDHVVAYWPLEDEGRAGRFTSGLSNDSSALDPTGEVEFAKFAEFDGSAALPTVGAGAIYGRVPYYTGADNQRFLTLVAVPEDGVHETRYLLRLRTSSNRWDVLVDQFGSMSIRIYDEYGDELYSSGAYTFELNGKLAMVSLWLQRNANGTYWQLSRFEVGASRGSIVEGTVPGTFDRFEQVQLGDRRGINGTAFGHVAIIDDNVHETIWDTVQNSLVAWAGETATDRIARLCREHDVPVTIVGTSDIQMGPQGQDTLLTLLRECETADQGVLYDGVGPGLAYIARERRENVDPAVVVDVAAGELAPDFEPTDDDQRNVNEVTAKQKGGSSVTVTDVDGPLGTRAIGTYDADITVNINAAARLRDYASWLVHLGTVEGYRYPSVSADLRSTPRRAAAWLAVRPSTRVTLANPSAVFAQLADEDISLLAEGTELTLSPYEWRVTAQCSPYDPWRVAVLAEQGGGTNPYVAHLDTVDSVLAEPAEVGATTLYVATNVGPAWTTNPDDWPIPATVAGIPVTVTAVGPVTGTAPRVQEFTVEAIGYPLPAGAAVNVHNPPTPGL